MTATLLAEGRTTLRCVPDVLDVDIMSDLLRRLGCTVEHDGTTGVVAVEVASEIGHQADYDLVRRMRASINVWVRCWRAAERLRSRCLAGMRSVLVASTCMLGDWSSSASGLRASTVS